MSATQETTTPSVEEAKALIYREVFIPMFFEKLSSHGLDPKNEEEAAIYLDIGQKLLAADYQEQTKLASNRVSFLKEANARLDRELNTHYGFTVPSNPESEYVKNAQAVLLDNPAIRQALDVVAA